MSVHDFTKTKAEREQAHAQRVIDLFKDHPELAKRAIIVYPPDPDIPGMCLAPEDMSTDRLIGILEAAKFNILMSSTKQ